MGKEIRSFAACTPCGGQGENPLLLDGKKGSGGMEDLMRERKEHLLAAMKDPMYVPMNL